MEKKEEILGVTEKSFGRLSGRHDVAAGRGCTIVG